MFSYNCFILFESLFYSRLLSYLFSCKFLFHVFKYEFIYFLLEIFILILLILFLVPSSIFSQFILNSTSDLFKVILKNTLKLKQLNLSLKKAPCPFSFFKYYFTLTKIMQMPFTMKADINHIRRNIRTVFFFHQFINGWHFLIGPIASIVVDGGDLWRLRCGADETIIAVFSGFVSSYRRIPNIS